MQPIEPESSVKVFISYVNADQDLLKKLEKHLSPLKDSEKISHWNDQKILAGTDWKELRKHHFDEAHIILLLVSPSFLHLKSEEIQAALKRQEAGTAWVIPVLLKPALWEGIPLGKLRMLPTDAKPITQWKNHDAAFKNVVQGIQEVVKQVRNILHSAALPSVKETGTCVPTLPLHTPGLRMEWEHALIGPLFYGREKELSQLTQWVVQERCRVVSLLGMGGIGKSALAVQLMHQLTQRFDVVRFCSLRDAPPCEQLLDDCLQTLAPRRLSIVPNSLEERLRLLLEQLRASRVLLVLDNLESLLEAGDVRGHLRPGFEDYEQLLRLMGEAAHQSCLLLTSREKPAYLRSLEGKQAPVRSLRLSNLDLDACEHLLSDKDVVGSPYEQARLVEAYAGNPLALKIVTEIIVDLFGGSIGPFLAEESLIFGTISDLLKEQFARLSRLEQTVLYWLAIVREPLILKEVQAILVAPVPQMQLVEAVDALRRRSLIEPGQRQGSFTLQSVVLEYVSTILIEEASHEIEQQQLTLLLEHSLEQASARDYVRQTQQRLLLIPLLSCLQSLYQGRGDVEARLVGLLDQLRQRAEHAQGYGPANLMALLRLQKGDLSGLDLSHLSIRGAYLQGVKMREARLVGAVIRDTVFTEAVSAIFRVAISQDGTKWAASSVQGEVRIWREEGQTLHLVWKPHTDMIMALAFSPDGRTLASGSTDNTVKLWDVESGTLLWTTSQIAPQNVAFSPDGNILACSGLSPEVYLWNAKTGVLLQSLNHPLFAFAIDWSPDGRLFVSNCFNGQLYVWERQKTAHGSSTEVLRLLHSWEMGPVWSLTIAPDGRTLASTGWSALHWSALQFKGDRKVKLWEVESGRLLHIFEEETTGRVSRVAWSPNGKFLASCSHEKAIYVFDVEQRRLRATLSGHIYNVNDIAFTPDSHRIFSGSVDNTLRVWAVENGHCIHVMHNYAVSLYDLDWSPDGVHLVSGGIDGVVTIWDVGAEMPLRELREGHTWIAYGVAWSPDGRVVASSGWDMVVQLSDPTSGACVRTLDGHSTVLQKVAWSPSGSLLAVANASGGIHVWDRKWRYSHWEGKGLGLVAFFSVGWSPDGSVLAGGSTDGGIYLWGSTDGKLRQRLSGHDGTVASLAWNPDGKFLVSAGEELLVWDMQAWKVSSSSLPVHTFGKFAATIYAVAWSPDGDCIISGSSDGVLSWWNVQSGECVCRQQAHHGAIRSLKVSPDGKFLASCGDDGAIAIWDLKRNEHLRMLRRNRPYERLNITGIRGLTDAQKVTLQTLGAIEDL